MPVANRDSDPTEVRREVWTRHWATGAAHSCVGSFVETYEGALADVWAEALQTTAPGTRVLDIGTGSGAIPRLMLRLRPQLDFSIDAVDMADVAPSWPQRLPADKAERIRFHAGVAAESLPFPDAWFGLITSQYGLEYANLARAVPELLRVLAPGGRVALTLHHASSRPVTLATIELAHIDWVFATDGLIQTARAMLEPMARTATPEGRASLAEDREANTARRRFNAAQSAVNARAQAAPDGADVLGEVQDSVGQLLLLAQRRGPTEAEAAWSDLCQRLIDSRWRLQELGACALSSDAAHALCDSLQAAGLQASLETLTEQGHLMGWRLNAA